MVVIDHKQRICSRLHDKKYFNHGFHCGILVRGCNCDRGHNRRLQEKITNGTNYKLRFIKFPIRKIVAYCLPVTDLL